ncbi:Replication protein [Marinobacter sp. LV10R510-11A]|uniref:protein rep n=1 Tax=Marinobacter sp. LV10R510-11A TaxID=1415568 RepID=UPI000BB7C79C|nr:protein rep [Marinobacter sp. LV10R510-11A]SOB76012.1 Replication protein [Marinobacter sp. LV10R510-11A]
MSPIKRKSTPLEDLRKYKEMTQETAGHFLSDGCRQTDGHRLLNCAKYVRTYRTPSNDTFIDALYCKHTHCPLCQRQKARKYRSKIHQLLDQNPYLLDSKWLYLTLTVRDCNVEDLRPTGDIMVKAFQRMRTRKLWKDNVLGGIRFIEVTESQVDRESVHPHFHCLLLVRPSMFAGNNYVSTVKWASEWQKALQAHYEPKVHIKRFNGKPDEIRSLIVGHAGYSMKPRKTVLDRRRFLIMTHEMRDLRRAESFGIIRTLFSELNGHANFEAIEQLEEIRQSYEPFIHVWDGRSNNYCSD